MEDTIPNGEEIVKRRMSGDSGEKGGQRKGGRRKGGRRKNGRKKGGHKPAYLEELEILCGRIG